MKEDNYRYIQFPLFLLQEFHRDIKEAMMRILSYGVYTYAIDHSTGDEVDIEAALHYFGVQHTIKQDMINEVYINWKLVAVELSERIKEPQPFIKVDTLIEFLTEKKTTRVIDLLSGFIAVKSILGQKAYYKTNNGFVLCRMMGYNTIKDIPDELPEHLHKMRKRFYSPKNEISKYKMKSFFDRLEQDWRVLKLPSSAVRGYVIGMADRTSYDEMALYLEKSKINRARNKADRNLAKKLALQNARNIIHNT